MHDNKRKSYCALGGLAIILAMAFIGYVFHVNNAFVMSSTERLITERVLAPEVKE